MLGFFMSFLSLPRGPRSSYIGLNSGEVSGACDWLGTLAYHMNADKPERMWRKGWIRMICCRAFKFH